MATSSNIQIKNAAIETIRSNDPLRHQIQIGTSQTNSYFNGRTDSIVMGTKMTSASQMYGLEFKGFDSNTNGAALQYLHSPRTNVVNSYPIAKVSSLHTDSPTITLQSDYGNFSNVRSENVMVSTLRVSTIYANQVIANDLYMDGIISGKTVQAVSFETNGTVATAENAVYIDALLYWMQTYLMPHKPSTILVTGSNIKGAELNVQWDNPETISFGVNSWMPVISKLNLRVTDSSTPIPKSVTLTRTAANEVPVGVGSLDALRAVALRKYGTTGSVVRSINGTNINTLLVNLSNEFQSRGGFTEPLKTEIWLENSSGAGPSTTLSNLQFPNPSPPSAPGLTLSGQTSSIFTITPIAPTTNDTSLPPGDVAMPDLSFYAIKYKALNNAIRYGGLSDNTNWVQIIPNPTTTNPINASNLHPDTTYEVQITATNIITTLPSAVTSNTITTNGTGFRPSYLDSVKSIDFTSVYAASSLLYKMSDSSVLDYAVLNASGTNTGTALYSATFGPIGLHSFDVRGSSSIVGGLYFDNGINQATFSTIGFPVSQSESTSSRDNTIIKPISRSDAGNTSIDQGYFVKQLFQIGLMKYAASAALRTLIFKQTLADNTTYSNTIRFYTDDVDHTATPSISSRSGQLNSIPTNVCGLKMYGTNVDYAVSNIVCTNMSQYFTLGSDTLVAKLNLGAKTAVVLDKAAGSYDSQNKTLTMLSNAPVTISFSFDNSDYYQNTSGQISLQVKNTANITSAWSLISPSFPILVDPASVATSVAYTRYAVPTSFSASLTPFNNSSALANGELMLYQGKFVSKGTTAAFMNYGSIAASGGTADYSTSPSAINRFNATNYRYAVFQFDVASGSGTTTISKLRIGIGGTDFDISTDQKSGSSIKLVKDNAGYNIEVWYKASQGSSTTRWMDATSDLNSGSFLSLVTSANPDYSIVLGGADGQPGIITIFDASGSRKIANFVVQVPSFQRNNTPITMYVMVGISDSSIIKISDVNVTLA